MCGRYTSRRFEHGCRGRQGEHENVRNTMGHCLGCWRHLGGRGRKGAICWRKSKNQAKETRLSRLIDIRRPHLDRVQKKMFDFLYGVTRASNALTRAVRLDDRAASVVQRLLDGWVTDTRELETEGRQVGDDRLHRLIGSSVVSLNNFAGKAEACVDSIMKQSAVAENAVALEAVDRARDQCLDSLAALQKRVEELLAGT